MIRRSLATAAAITLVATLAQPALSAEPTAPASAAPTTTPAPGKAVTKILLTTPKQVKVRSGRGRVTFVVTAEKFIPSGEVRVQILGAGKNKRVTVTLNEYGKGKVMLPKYKKTGLITVRAAYLGDAASLPITEVKRFRAVSPSPSPSPSGPAASAVADLATRLEVDPATIEVVSQEAVTWRDGSLGCAKPGFAYTQALVEGSRITLRAEGTDYEYHSGGSREPFWCERPTE